MKVFNRILLIFVIMCSISIIITVGTIIYISKSHKLEYRNPYRYMDLTFRESWKEYSREEVRTDLESVFNAENYKYQEGSLLKDGIYGVTMPMYRTITMDDSISIELYTFGLAHEFVHLTEFTASERYCNLTAFKKLYESEKYRDVAISYAIKDRDGEISKDYSCWEYIYDYLNEGDV